MIIDPPPGYRVPLTRYDDLLGCKSDRQRNWMHRWLNEFRSEKPRSGGDCQTYESQQDERSTLDSMLLHGDFRSACDGRRGTLQLNLTSVVLNLSALPRNLVTN